MKSLADRMRLAKAVLKELERKPLSRTDIARRTVRKVGTYATFEGIFRFLVQNGYVEKSEQKHRAPYVITEKGAKFLEAL